VKRTVASDAEVYIRAEVGLLSRNILFKGNLNFHYFYYY
jgi:hypothetical protein